MQDELAAYKEALMELKQEMSDQKGTNVHETLNDDILPDENMFHLQNTFNE